MNHETLSLFVTRGPLHPEKNKHLYIEREEDASVLKCVLGGTYVALLGSRQSGKTSLLRMLRHKLLKRKEMKVAMVDLSRSTQKPEGWYSYICRRVLDQLGIGGKIRVKLLQNSSPGNFDEFLKKVAGTVSGPKIMLFDEIGSISPGVFEPFMWTVRSVFTNRDNLGEEAFAEYVFVLAGARELQQLTKGDGTVSPFNIAEKIYMSDFSQKGTRQLVEVLGNNGFSVDEHLDRLIHDYTGGHPYLTQRLCMFVEEVGKATPVTKSSIELAVDKLLDGDDCLTQMIDRLQDSDAIGSLAKRIVRGESIKFDRLDQEIIALILAGAIRADAENNCALRSLICEKALRRHFGMEDSITRLEEPTPRKKTSPWPLRVMTTITAAITFGVVFLFSRDWTKTTLSLPLFWLFSSLTFYFVYIKFRDNTNDPERVIEFENVTVQSLYDPIIKTDQEHSVWIEVHHKHPEKVHEVTVNLRPLGKNLGVISDFQQVYTRAQESKEFKLMLRRRATLWAWLFPFAEQHLVEFRAKVGNERRSGLIKMNADYTSSLIWSAIVSIASLVVSLIDLASKIKGLLKP